MHSRREIRQATIQLLYCSDIEGGAPAEEATESFWELLLEDDFTKFTKASVKSVLHLNQGRQKRYVKLVEQAPLLVSIIDSDPSARKLRIALNAVLKSENKWQSLLDSLQRIFKPSDQEIPTDLPVALKEIYLLNKTLRDQRKAWFEQLEDHPSFNNKSESVNASISAIGRVSDRIIMVENPSDFPQHSDVKHLIGTAAKMTTFKEAVNNSVSLVTKNKEAIDSKINEVVENYAPERIDPVDRAILRLGVAEILFNSEVPNAVAINEAIEISQSLSNTDSSKFVNGILDKIAKSNA